MTSTFEQRLEQALTKANIERQPLIFLAVVPDVAVQMPSLFQDTSPLVRAFNEPPRVGQTEWDFTVRMESAIVNGQCRRAMVPNAIIRELWQDGMLLAAREMHGYIQQKRNGEEFTRIHPRPLAATIHAFVQLSEIVNSNALPQISGCTYIVGMKNLPPVSLVSGKPGTHEHERIMPEKTVVKLATSSTFESSYTLTRPTIGFGTSALPVDNIAYELMCRVYRWFGLPDDKVPYTRQTNGSPGLDPDEIVRIEQESVR